MSGGYRLEMTSCMLCENVSMAEGGLAVDNPIRSITLDSFPSSVPFYISIGFYDVPPEGFRLAIVISSPEGQPDDPANFSNEGLGASDSDTVFSLSIPEMQTPDRDGSLPLNARVNVNLSGYSFPCDGRYILKVFADGLCKGSLPLYVFHRNEPSILN